MRTNKTVIYVNDDLKIAYEQIAKAGHYALCTIVDYKTHQPLKGYGWVRLRRGFRCVYKNGAKFRKKIIKTYYVRD